MAFCLIAALATARPSHAQVFVEVSTAAGLHTGDAKHGGVAWGDLDDDGCLDLAVTTASGVRVYRQASAAGAGCPGSFTDITAAQLPALVGEPLDRCATWADVNNDGELDLAVSGGAAILVLFNHGAPDFLFGDGSQASLRIDSASAGFAPGFIGWLDFDLDGALDLIVDNDDLGVLLFANDGSGQLTEVAATNSGLPGATAGYLSGDFGAVADFDVDGWVDVAVRKEGGPDLFRNVAGTFTEVAGFDQEADAANEGGVAFCDLDADGDLDLVWTDHGTNQIWERRPSGFAATGDPAVLADVDDVNGVACGDVDNDGDLDLFFTRSAGARDPLLINNGYFWFSDLGLPIGTGDGAGAALADYDGDGDLDILINQDDGNELWQNQHDGDDFLKVRALRALGGGIVSDALGTHLQLFDCAGNAVSAAAEVNGGRGFGSQDPAVVHFGLRHGADAIVVLRASWPGGAVTERALRPADLSAASHLVAVRRTDADDRGLCAEVPDDLRLSCPPSVDEGDPVRCSVTLREGPSPCAIGAADTCGGEIDAACLGPYASPNQDEAVGPGSCTVEVVKGDAAFRLEIPVYESPAAPYVELSCPGVLTPGDLLRCPVIAGDEDLPAQTVTCRLSDEDTCAGLLTGCETYDAGERETSCRASVRVTDSGVPALSSMDTVDVIVVKAVGGSGGSGSGGTGGTGGDEPPPSGCSCGATPGGWRAGLALVIGGLWVAGIRRRRRRLRG